MLAYCGGTRRLPANFSHLERFVDGWGDETADARERKRRVSAMEEIAEFHAAMLPWLERVFTHLDAFDVRALPPPEARLLRLTFGYVEAALAVEIFEAPGVPGTIWPHGFSITRELL
jgi:hypothetical protein